ncbi:hypothetical protein NEIELOOT_01919 [Neisseria elongata subsp. glycolytica ATCC 29315]|uniref:Uncharacterized protein n=1 Tax=Neisseria elongata subsp. glycolytica ATCC 29315 TaxID=546263 RepID=D4DS75_NEIEG|nr:hypothetical protein NEIELOOT_01919 [Neisseria elongata subsp. glycolytica ATCC 29315]
MPSRIYPLTALPFKNIIRPSETHCICYGRQRTDAVPLSTLPASDLQPAAFKPIHPRLRQIHKQRPSENRFSGFQTASMYQNTT